MAGRAKGKGRRDSPPSQSGGHRHNPHKNWKQFCKYSVVKTLRRLSLQQSNGHQNLPQVTQLLNHICSYTLFWLSKDALDCWLTAFLNYSDIYDIKSRWEGLQFCGSVQNWIFVRNWQLKEFNKKIWSYGYWFAVQPFHQNSPAVPVRLWFCAVRL